MWWSVKAYVCFDTGTLVWNRARLAWAIGESCHVAPDEQRSTEPKTVWRRSSEVGCTETATIPICSESEEICACVLADNDIISFHNTLVLWVTRECCGTQEGWDVLLCVMHMK